MGKNKSSGTIYFITGNDETRISAAADELFHQLAGDNPDPFASDVITVREGVPLQNLVSQTVGSILSPSFFGGTKVVWLKHFTGFGQEGTAKSETAIGKALHVLADKMKTGLPEGVVLIMDGMDCDRKKSFWKICQEVADIREYSKPDMKNKDWRDAMRVCIRESAERRNMTISFDVAEALIDTIGCNSDLVDMELDKLACYCGGLNQAPTSQDVMEICTASGEDSVWALGECIGKRNLSGALDVVEGQVAVNGDPEGRGRAMLFNAFGVFSDLVRVMVFMAVNKIKNPAALKSFLSGLTEEQKKNYRATGNTVGTMHPYRAMLIAENAVRYTPHELIQAIVTIRDAMWQTTSSSISPMVALENALMKILPSSRGRHLADARR